MKTFIRLISFAKPYSRFAVPYFFLTLISTFFGLINIAFILPILDLLFNATKSLSDIPYPEPAFSVEYFKGSLDYLTAWLIANYGKSTTLIFIAAFLISTNLLTNLFKYLAMVVNIKLRTTLMYNMREGLFKKIVTMDVGFFSTQRKGDLMSRMTNDLAEIENSVISALQVFLRDPFTLIIWFTAMFAIQWQLMVLTLSILPISGLGISLISKKLKKESTESQKSSGHILSLIDEAISGIRIIKGFVAESFIFTRFSNQGQHYANLSQKIGKKRELASPITEVMGVTIVSAILFIGGNLVFEGKLEASVFFMVIIGFYKILEPLKGIASSFTAIQTGISAGNRLFEIIDADVKVQDPKNPKTLTTFNHSIQLKNIGFKYDENEVLKNVNIEIPKGKLIALVGPSGGGKSTLVDLIPRFYDPATGTVEIDGINIKEFDLHSLRSHIGIVTQESILFNDSIFNNIAFGLPNITQADVERAARIANAHEFIINSEDGYQTSIGERGSKLSGGQRQRLSIARAVLKNPDILILDEATSALDNESEKLVQEALNYLMKERTSIVIAHRLSTIRHADLILVLDKGEIKEQGTHEELISKAGIYYKLHQHANETGGVIID
jgi:ATP-binding cassette, subfamily B, bacterial MsbA